MKNNTSTAKIKLELPAASVNEGFARVFAAAFAARLDPTIEEMADIKTAVSEAVTNAIVHGYPDTTGMIYITARVLSGNTVEFVIRDKGEGIPDIKQAISPLFTTGGEERSGMGFTIMQSFMDKLSVTSKPGKGTRVRLLKQITPRPGTGGKK